MNVNYKVSAIILDELSAALLS